MTSLTEPISDAADTARQQTGSTSPGISDLTSLREHLQWAVEVEHATIPSYLCALYSLEPVPTEDVADVLHSVVLEEMLHLALAANLLNAVGGRPEIDSPRLLPGYPRTLPHRDPPLEIPLLPFGREALKLFLEIERPCTPEAPPQPDRYQTIGQFYDAIRVGFAELCSELGEAAVFCGDPLRQVADETFRGGPGRIFRITGLATALDALALIVEQGEGTAHVTVWDGDHDMFHPERDEVGHYYRFMQLDLGRRFRRGDTPLSGPTGEQVLVDWDAVKPMRPNPRSEDYQPGTDVRDAMDRFNSTYCRILGLLDDAFDGAPQRLDLAISEMFRLKTDAQALMNLPTDEDGLWSAGPSFEYVPASLRTP